MRITEIEAIPFRLPPRRDFRWAGLNVDLGSFVLVRLHTDGAHVGLGEATPLPDWGGDNHLHGGETVDTVIHLVRDVLGPSLVGTDPLAYEATRHTLDTVVRGNSYAKAAIDMALHDLAGKACGLPIHRMLGGPHRSGVAVAHMVGIMPFDDAISEAEAAVSDGVKAIQVKGGIDPERDVHLVAQLRDLLGPPSTYDSTPTRAISGPNGRRRSSLGFRRAPWIFSSNPLKASPRWPQQPLDSKLM
jgi:L-alanine-DL-glutamate epimerase-like enolase superfamily enzyme